MKKLTVVLLIAFAALAFGACDMGQAEADLAGTWESQDGTELTMSRSAVQVGDEISGDVQNIGDSAIEVEMSREGDEASVAETWEYSIDGDTLTITVDGYEMEFTRQ